MNEEGGEQSSKNNDSQNEQEPETKEATVATEAEPAVVEKEVEEKAEENVEKDSQESPGAPQQDGLHVKQIIEGVLLAAGKPVPMNKIAEIFSARQRPEPEVLRAALKEIEQDCEGRGFELKKVASGYRFQVKQQYSEWVGKLWEERPPRYSRALLETISIIAYRQPITRGEIEKIRGVAVSSNIIRTLLDREWVRVVGHRDVPGRPAMYATTREFLDYFDLKSLEQLPPLSEIRDMEEFEQKLSLDEEMPESRVLEFPSAEELAGEEFDVPDEEEEAAAAIGTRPIEEILGIQDEPEEDDDWDELDEDAGGEEAATGEGSEGALQDAEEDAEENEISEGVDVPEGTEITEGFEIEEGLEIVEVEENTEAEPLPEDSGAREEEGIVDKEDVVNEKDEEDEEDEEDKEGKEDEEKD